MGVSVIFDKINEFMGNPHWLIWTFIILIVGSGVVINSFLATRLAGQHLLPTSLHLAITDIASLMFLAPYELIILADGTGVWTFPVEYCRLFLGLEVLLGTATVYLIIGINFSAMSESKRSMKIPLLIIWLLAVSLSVPHFSLSKVITLTPEYQTCYMQRHAAILVSAFRMCLPSVLLITASIFILLNLLKSSEQHNFYEIVYAAMLSSSYIIFSGQRTALALIYGIYSPSVAIDAYRTPPLAEVTGSPNITLLLAGLHYSLSALRPVICLCTCQTIRLKARERQQDVNTHFNYPL